MTDAAPVSGAHHLVSDPQQLVVGEVASGKSPAMGEHLDSRSSWICRDCSVVLTTKEEANQHQTETLAAGEFNQWGNQSSHTVIAPSSPENDRQRAARMGLSDALDVFFASLDDQVDMGHLTEVEIDEEIRTLDLASARRDWVRDQ